MNKLFLFRESLHECERCRLRSAHGPFRARRDDARASEAGLKYFVLGALSSGLLVLVILVLIAVSTSQQASSWFSTEGLKVFSNTWNPAANQFGALAFIYGTAITAVIAIIIAVPVSVGVALLLNEVVPYRWSRPIVRFLEGYVAFLPLMIGAVGPATATISV